MSSRELSAEPAIAVRDVSKTFRLYTDKPSDLKQAITRLSRARYEEFVALRNVSLDVPKGESASRVKSLTTSLLSVPAAIADGRQTGSSAPTIIRAMLRGDSCRGSQLPVTRPARRTVAR